MGTLTRSIFRPLGRSNVARVRPSGSDCAAIASTASAIAATRSWVRVRRSMNAASLPLMLSRSAAFAVRMSSVRARSAFAASRSAKLRWSAVAKASSCAAAFARWPRSATTAATSIPAVSVLRSFICLSFRSAKSAALISILWPGDMRPARCHETARPIVRRASARSIRPLSCRSCWSRNCAILQAKRLTGAQPRPCP